MTDLLQEFGGSPSLDGIKTTIDTFDTLKSSIENKLFKLDGSTIICTGHGSETSVDYEKKYNSFI